MLHTALSCVCQFIIKELGFLLFILLTVSSGSGRCLFQSLIEFLPIHRGMWLGLTLEGIIVDIHLHLRCLQMRHRGDIQVRDVGAALHIKVYGRDSIEAGQGFTYRSHYNLPDGRLVFKLYLRLGGMNIHIHIGRINIEIQEIRNLLTFGNQMIESLHDSLMKIRMAHVTPIDKEVLGSILLSCRFGFSHEALHIG